MNLLFSEVLFIYVLGTAVVGLFAYGMGFIRFSATPAGLGVSREKFVFIFEGCALVDATEEARQLFDTAAQSSSDWSRLTEALSPRFDGLQDLSKTLETDSNVAIPETSGSSSLIIRRKGSRTRVVLLEAGKDRPKPGVDHSLMAEPEEVRLLRDLADQTPTIMWRLDQDGAVTWANAAYIRLIANHSPDAPAPWPLPNLFPDLRPDAFTDPAGQRYALMDQNTKPLNVMVTKAPCDDGHLFFATPCNDLVRAEGLLTNFVQTMTKTFADLPEGLAVFNRERKLTLFNPALTDLLKLDPSYLITRPGLEDFFDHLRENRKIPEPKNYRDWRERLATLDQKAQEGKFCETWALESGLTFRVTGRPHPDGALAFLIEDISSEVTLTRRFRQELDQTQAVLDGFKNALAVFSPAGVLVQSNLAYSHLWDTDPSTSLQDLTVHDTTQHWRSLCHPSPVWGEVRNFVHSIEERSEWSDQIRRLDGRLLILRCIPIAGGATMVTFCVEHYRDGQDIGSLFPPENKLALPR